MLALGATSFLVIRDGIYIRTGSARTEKDLEHMEILEFHLRDDHGWRIHPGRSESRAENATGSSASDELRIHPCLLDMDLRCWQPVCLLYVAKGCAGLCQNKNDQPAASISNTTTTTLGRSLRNTLPYTNTNRVPEKFPHLASF